MKKWITYSDLCSRWDINIYDLIELVSACKLRSYYAEDLSEIKFGIHYDTFQKIEPGRTGADPTTFNVDEVRKLIFRITDIEEYEKKNDITPYIIPTNQVEQEQKIAEIEQKAFEGHFDDAVTISGLKDENEKLKRPEDNKELTVPHCTRALIQDTVNFFTKETDGFWHIGFEGKDARINHLDGIYYIAILLKSPNTSVSCRNLYSDLSGKVPDNVISAGEAMDECLNTASRKQEVNTPEAKAEYNSRLNKLEGELEIINQNCTPETDMQRKEIEEEMDAIINTLKNNNFANPDDKKVQANISRRLETAYKTIGKKGLKNLEKHLRKTIKTDKAYGQIYTGNITWEITIK